MVLAVVILFAALPIITRAADIQLSSAARWSTAFANEDIPIVMSVRGGDDHHGTVRWSHSANSRTLDRGTVPVVDNEVPGGKASFTLRPQPIRDGVILKTTLSTAFISHGQGEATASHDQTIWLFPRNPLANRSDWFASLDIRLFDPERKTADAFDEIELPYEFIPNVARVSDPDWRGILIIGEGISLRQQPAITETAIRAAVSGRRVVLLSPLDGSLALPGLDLSQPQADISVPTELRFARHHIIAEFDKRLDHLAWFGANRTLPARGLSIESRRGRLTANVSDDPLAWPWLELKYADHDGTLIVCGFEVIAHWNTGPTPRYLLIRLLEALSQSSHHAPRDKAPPR